MNRDGSLSRSRTTDAEKDAAGVMTSQQHAEHTALQPKRSESGPTTRLAAVPDDDPWYDSPAAGAALGTPAAGVPEDRPGSIDSRQQRQMHAEFRRLQVTDRDQRLRDTRDALGLPELASSSDLSWRQADDLLRALKEQPTP